MKVLVTDPLIAGYLDVPSWEVLTHRSGGGGRGPVAEADVLVAARVTPSMAAAATRLRLLLVPGAGRDRIALDALDPDERLGVTLAGRTVGVVVWVRSAARWACERRPSAVPR